MPPRLVHLLPFLRWPRPSAQLLRGEALAGLTVGLMVIPYIDINPKGNGYYCFEDRKWEILTFILGFHILWVSLIVIGTPCSGPSFLPARTARSAALARLRAPSMSVAMMAISAKSHKG